jgi:hypothetical protein
VRPLPLATPEGFHCNQVVAVSVEHDVVIAHGPHAPGARVGAEKEVALDYNQTRWRSILSGISGVACICPCHHSHCYISFKSVPVNAARHIKVGVSARNKWSWNDSRGPR